MPPPLPATLRARFDALSPRERRMLGLLAFALLVFVAWLLMRDGGAEDPVELAAAPPTPVAATPPPVAYAPPPSASVAPPPAPASASGLLLVGIFGGGPGGGAAILQGADGSQRLVRMGREFQPGLALRSVGINHVVIGGPGGDLRLEIGKTGSTPVAAAIAAPAPAVAGPTGPSSDATRRETLQYQLGTEPVTVDGVRGHRIKPGAPLPHLDKAGLQPGDVIVGINGGNGFTEERLMELSYDIASGSRTEFEVIRNGRRMKMAIER